MIQPENWIFNDVATAIREKYQKSYVIGEYTDIPAVFPCVTITEESNNIVDSRRDMRNIENAVLLLYEVNVYSNLTRGKKEQAKEIQAIIDERFCAMGFKRAISQQMPNIADGTIFRIFSRYEGIDEPVTDGEDIIHYIHSTN